MVPVAVWLVVAAYSVAAAAPSTVLDLPGMAQARPQVAQALPQGWGFFTKSQRDPMVGFYTLDGGEARSEMLLPSSRWENAFGASRRGRSEGVEVALLAHQVATDGWLPCRSPQVSACLREHADHAPQVIDSTTPAARLCDRGFLVETEPVAWSYRHLTDDRLRANAVAPVEVTC